MKMVAASKMRNAQAAVEHSRGIVEPFVRLFGDYPGEGGGLPAEEDCGWVAGRDGVGFGVWGGGEHGATVERGPEVHCHISLGFKVPV